jgi:hypothetical protein
MTSREQAHRERVATLRKQFDERKKDSINRIDSEIQTIVPNDDVKLKKRVESLLKQKDDLVKQRFVAPRLLSPNQQARRDALINDGYPAYLAPDLCEYDDWRDRDLLFR